jgi:preprotein translocase subunit SecB
MVDDVLDHAAAARHFSIRQVYLRNVSFDAPRLADFPQHVLEGDMDKVEFNVVSTARQFLDDRYALEVRFDVHATLEDVTVFRATVDELGTFIVVGYTHEEAMDLLRTEGIEAVYPYARELIQSLAGRCGVQRLGLPAVAIGIGGAAQR